METVSRKGWTAATLEALNVRWGPGDRWQIPTAAGVLRYADDGRTPKMIAPAGSTRELWPAPEEIGEKQLVVVEGEPDAISAHELGYPAVALPGAGKFDEGWPARLLNGRPMGLVLIGDCDSVGRIRMRSLAEKVVRLGGVVQIVDLAPERDDGYDIGDVLVDLGAERAREAIDNAILHAVPFVLEAPSSSESRNGEPSRTSGLLNLADYAPRQAEFLWWPYLPLGKVVIVAGAPGNGKSQFASLITAMATRAALYPGNVTEPSRVLMLSAEDDLEDTVVPRLLAVNADLRLVDTIEVVTRYSGGLTARGMIRLPGDADAVHAWAQAHANARLVVMDPVASFFERRYSTFVNQDVRDALGPLIAIAQTFGITVVIILHLNKSETKDFTARIAESHGFQALARSVIAIGPDPDDPEGERGSKKIIAVTKANLVKPGRFGLRCEVRSATLTGYGQPIETSDLALTGKCDISADDLMMSGSDRTTRMEAAAWLADFVADRWVKVADVRKAATSDGFSWRTIERIRAQQGYQRAKEPGVARGPWWIAASTTPTPIPGTGGVDGLGGEGGSTPQRPPVTGTGDGVVDPDSQDRNPANPANGANPAKPFDLDEYRRWQDRMLGEPEEDDDA